MFSSSALTLCTALRHRQTLRTASQLRLGATQQQEAHHLTRRLCRPPRRPYSSKAPPPPPGPKAKPTPASPKTEDAIPVPNTVPPLPFWQRLGPLTSLARAYSRAQKRRPWLTQFCTALVIYMSGDLSAQYINAGDDGLEPDLSRTGRSLVIGGISAIPSYLWFIWLSHNFNYSSHILSLATKIVVNQILFTPTFNTYFFGMQAMLSGCSPSQVVDRIVTAVPTSIMMSCRFWPVVTAFSFTFVPIQHRSVFSGVIAIGWQTYLALLNRKAELKAAASAVAQADDGAALPEGRQLTAA